MELSGRAVVLTPAAGGCAPGELEAPTRAVIALVGAHGGLKLPCRTHLAVHLTHLLLVLALATVSAANGTGSRCELACSARCADGGVPSLGLELASRTLPADAVGGRSRRRDLVLTGRASGDGSANMHRSAKRLG